MFSPTHSLRFLLVLAATAQTSALLRSPTLSLARLRASSLTAACGSSRRARNLRACDVDPQSDVRSDPPDGKTTVGSKAYYQGFLETPLEEVRGDGMEQAVKLAAGTAAVVGGLTLAFLASNGLV